MSSRNRGHYSETKITPEESPCRSLLRFRLSQGCTLAGSLNLQAVRKRRFFALCFRLRIQSLPLRMTILCDAFVFSFRRHQGTALRIGFPSRGSSRLCRVMRCCSLHLNRFSKVALLSGRQVLAAARARSRKNNAPRCFFTRSRRFATSPTFLHSSFCTLRSALCTLGTSRCRPLHFCTLHSAFCTLRSALCPLCLFAGF